jgi:outer membrane protein assembly factor BamB
MSRSKIIKLTVLIVLVLSFVISIAPFAFTRHAASKAHAAAAPSLSVYFGSNNDTFYALTADEGFLRWQYQYQQGGNTWSPAVVVNGVIYVEVSNSTSTAIISLRADGSKRWIFQFPSQTTGRNAVAVANGMVYFAVESSVTTNTLYADTRSGRPGFRLAVESSVTTNTLYALNAKDGSVVWTHPAGANEAFGNPLVDNSVLYVAESPSASGSSPQLDALNASDGSVIWTQTIPNAAATNLVAANGVIYFGGSIASVYAVNESDGTLLWSSQVDGGAISTPTIGNGIVYFAAANNYLTAVNASDGSLLWHYLFGKPFAATVSPVLYGMRVFIGSLNRNMYAFTASTGTLIWQTKIDAPITTTASIKNGIVHAGLQNGTLRTLNSSDGKQRWFYHTLGTIVTSSPPVVA